MKEVEWSGVEWRVPALLVEDGCVLNLEMWGLNLRVVTDPVLVFSVKPGEVSHLGFPYLCWNLHI